MEHARQLASKLRGWCRPADPLLREKNISASFGIAAIHSTARRRKSSSNGRRFDVSFETSGAATLFQPPITSIPTKQRM